jgi:hypothetical protein
MLNFTIDLHKNRIEFTDSRFYLTDQGTYVPSVTTVLEAFPKDASYFKWIKEVGGDADQIRDEAGRRGSTVHELTERYDSGEEVQFLGKSGLPTFKMLEWSMFERYVDFTNTYKPSVDMMEVNIVSKKLGYAGTLDRVINLNGQVLLVDIKTSNNIYPSYWLQLAAYHELLKTMKVQVDGVAILWLNAKTRTTGKGGAIQGIGWQLIQRSLTEVKKDLKLFKSTYDLWKFMNEDVKPRNLSYQIKHKRDEMHKM